MQNALHYRGVWFLPEDTEAQIPGLLDFTPSGGADLQLFGVFANSKNLGEDEVAIILGITSDGKKITLYKCSEYQRGFHSNGLENASYEALYMLVGLLIPKENLIFNCINIQFQDFDFWLNIYGFKKNEHKTDSKETTVEYQQPKDISFLITPNIQCDFKFSTHGSSRKSTSKLTIEQVCEVALSYSDGPTNFEALFKLFQTFQILLTLSYSEKPLVNCISLSKEVSSDSGGTYVKHIDLYFVTEVTTETYKEKNHSRKFLFTYNDVKAHFSSILQKWYEAEGSLAPTIYGLSEAFSKKSTAIELSFLNIAHAIETLHRRRRNNQVLPQEAHRAKVKEILSSVSSDHTTWLKSKLEFSNEPTLQERLVELIEELPQNIRKVLLKPSQEEFIKQFKWSRNYYTHYNKSLEKKTLKGGELFYLKERSKILLVCFMLKEMGLSDKEIERVIFNKGVVLFNHIVKYDEVQQYMYI